ncbi:PREDICTED: ribosome biogenesis protein BOP1 homolog [Dinoponera quadriceps]|uniref:Ribosome biogenesis protein BOP1 homolog n=1 Tax=Dinoponera quadriceps TaxID=609295 RepID=A0A6P3Y753_DINQU|nr:PREDICTED: ribosome biogenesis protein BOP1 homolog [Dinoponera quadriceps]
MARKRGLKRKHANSKVEEDKGKTEEAHVEHHTEDSDTEDLLATEINDYEDSTDETTEEADIPDSDTEQDLVFPSSGDEDSELEFESDKSMDGEDSESAESESDSHEETRKSSQIKRRDDKKKLSDDSKRNKKQSVKKSTSKNKLLVEKEIRSVSELNNGEDREDSPEIRTGKDDLSNDRPSHTEHQEEDEYDYDSSDEEDIRNTVGNIPMKWYDEYDHVGYDWESKKILKPEKGDELDNFLKRMEDPDFWRTIKDPQTGRDVVLKEDDIDLIVRIQKQKVPDVQFDEYAPWVEWFTSEAMKMPLRKFPEHKRSFLPSKDEARQVSKLVHALKMGWIKSSAEMKREREERKQGPQFYMLWQSNDQAEEMRRIHKHIPAPKRHLPGHAESYNPPPEYLFDNRELREWNKLKATPWKRKLHFVPQKFDSLREVPAYPKYIKERFQRCLDLYLCPRAYKMRLTIKPEELVPQLPNPKDLQPFPTKMSMVFNGHTDMVRSITSEAIGQYIASGGDDMSLKIWEVSTGRCVKTVPCGGVIRSVAWCPNQAVSLIAVAADKKVLLINPGVGDRLITGKTDELLEIIPQSEVIVSERVRSAVQWEQAEGKHHTDGIRVILNHFRNVKQVTWHGKGDYFATVMPDGQNRSVLINQLSKRKSQLPFSKSKGLIQCVLFHPIRPYLFVATQRNVRIYDLVKQEMMKKLLSNSQWISSMAIHPGGDNVLVATYDRKMLWFDLDLSTKPYQTLRLHGTGVRSVAFHKRYPLFSSGADDRGLIVSHGMVYNDLLQNPLIVPLKRFHNHESYNDFGILDVMFHPTQPWVFSAGADFTIRMYT